MNDIESKSPHMTGEYYQKHMDCQFLNDPFGRNPHIYIRIAQEEYQHAYFKLLNTDEMDSISFHVRHLLRLWPSRSVQPVHRN